jgi:HK97 family phage portal protein
MANLSKWLGWFGRGSAINNVDGTQNPVPAMPIVEGSALMGPDSALQISTVWACVDRRATTIASLPFFAYEQQSSGQKVLARGTLLYQLLHESPNPRMTPLDFWRAMVLNHDLRGNAYARLERNAAGEVIAMWPLPADQVEVEVTEGGVIYYYRLGADIAVLAEQNVLHLKNLGNGTVGLSKLDFMRSTTDEAAKAQSSASKTFGTGGKPTGVLMVDSVLKPEQRQKIKENFAGMAEGSTSRLYLLEANMKYQQLSMSPEDQQLLETRRFSVEEICRWYDVPPVLVHHSNVTTWGSGIEQIMDGFYKLTIRPMLVAIEQAVRRKVLTPRQRAYMVAEFALDALLRGSPAQRAELYSKNVQNGIMTRNECRQLENLPPMSGADELTAQSNLLPLSMLGQQTGGANASTQDPIAQ